MNSRQGISETPPANIIGLLQAVESPQSLGAADDIACSLTLARARVALGCTVSWQEELIRRIGKWAVGAYRAYGTRKQGADPGFREQGLQVVLREHAE